MFPIKAVVYLELVVIVAFMLVEICVVEVNGVSVEEDLTLTYQEKLALDKFKVRVMSKLTQNYMKQDIYLIRWLRARNLNVDLAEQMLLQNLRWRNQNKMDTINDEDWLDLQEDYPYTVGDRDKKGRPIGTISMAQWSIRKAYISGTGPRFQRYMRKLLEEATQAVIREQELGNNVTQWKILMNMEGFNTIQHACPVCLPHYATFVSDYESYFPGYADGLILINTPPAFKLVLDIVRPIFTPPTRKALKVFGADKKQWSEYLDKSISKEERRPEFGGTKID